MAARSSKAPTPAVLAKKPAAAPRARRKPAASVDSAAVDPLPEPRGQYLIGENRVTAAAVAEHEWGWKRTKTGWTDGAGAPVHYLEDLAELRAACAQNPILVYQGYRWYSCIPSHLFDQLAEAKRVVVLPSPEAQPIV